MSDALQTAPYTHSFTHDPEGLQSAQGKKTPPPSVFSRPLSLARRYPFLLSFAISVIITGTVAAVVRLSDIRYEQDPYSRIPLNASGVVLIGHSDNFDEPTRGFSMQWEILGCGEYRLPTSYSPVNRVLEAAGCDVLDRAADIYFNNVPTPTYSYSPAYFPFTPSGERQHLWDLATFTRGHLVDYLDTNMAPFDVCSSSTLIFVIERGTNEPVPIVALTAGRAPENFELSSVQMETMSNYTYVSETGPTTISVNSGVVRIEARRSQFARAFTMCLLLANWALATCSIYIAVLVVSRRVETNEGILFLPVTIILTIPALRALYPGSRSFGIFIDSFGFVPQIMTVAGCSTLLVYFVAVQKPVSKRRAPHDN